MSFSVPGTACPWKFRGTGVDNPGSSHSTAGGFAAGFNDGSTAGGAGVGVNTAYRYGAQHTSPAGETNPVTVACVAGQMVVLTYVSGLVQTQGGGAGDSDPTGSATSTELNAGPNETDNNGYNYPVNFVSGSTTKIGGLCGCFTDSSGVVIDGSFWDWKSRGGTSSANSFITLTVPVGATFLSMGIVDTILRDNTGSFTMSTVAIDGLFVGIDNGWFGDTGYFVQYPVGQVTPGALRDQTNLSGTNLKATVLLSVYWMPQTIPAASFTGRLGQLFPHGGQQAGNSPPGAGQNFPY
jgi:hypothetical protein